MATEFKVGDVVRLKSGGPPMTVTEVGKASEEPTIWCQWFEGADTKNGTFPPGGHQTHQQKIRYCLTRFWGVLPDSAFSFFSA